MGLARSFPPCSAQCRRMRSSVGDVPSMILSRRHRAATLSMTPPDRGNRSASTSASSAVIHGSLARQIFASTSLPGTGNSIFIRKRRYMAGSMVVMKFVAANRMPEKVFSSSRMTLEEVFSSLSEAFATATRLPSSASASSMKMMGARLEMAWTYLTRRKKSRRFRGFSPK